LPIGTLKPEYEKTTKTSTATLIQRLTKYMKDGFYFAEGYDLTASRIRRYNFEMAIKSGNKEASRLEMIACDSRFFWNMNNY